MKNCQPPFGVVSGLRHAKRKTPAFQILNILLKAESVFDKVIIGIGRNFDKIKNEKSLEKVDEYKNDQFFKAHIYGKKNPENFFKQLKNDTKLFEKTIYDKMRKLLAKVRDGLFCHDDDENNCEAIIKSEEHWQR